MKSSYVLVAGLAVSVLLAGCSGGPGAAPGASVSPTTTPTVTSTATPTSTSTSTATSTSAPTASSPTVASSDSTQPVVTPSPPRSEDQVVVPPNASTTRKALEAAVGTQLVLTQIRTATHPGVDRVVLEFSGTGSPGWDVAYVDKATSQGSGNAVAVAGKSILAIRATGTTYPASGSPAVPKRIPADGKGVVTEVVNDSTFEGRTLVFVGLNSGQKPFDVQAMQSPTRLVVDIVH